jgi:hypothetical protein
MRQNQKLPRARCRYYSTALDVRGLGVSGLLLVSAPPWSQPVPSQSPVQSPVRPESSVSSNAGDPGETEATDRLIEQKCPGVEERQRQRDAHRLMAAVGEPTRPALRRELLFMMERDQEARTAAMASSLSTDNPTFAAVTAIDAENLSRLKHIIIQDGFLSRSMVGDDGVNAAWLLVQHADSDSTFQARILKILAARVRRHEFDSVELAMLTDRVLVHQGKPQRYGTQFGDDGSGLKPGTMEDPAHVDERRLSVGLGPLAEYACVIQAMFGASRGK